MFSINVLFDAFIMSTWGFRSFRVDLSIISHTQK